MTEFLPPDYAELRPTPFAGCELWHGLDTIIHNQHVLYHMLERLLGRTSQIVTDLSPIANAVANETSVEQSVITLVQQLADEVRANAGDPAAVQQLADQITANATALSQAITANTSLDPAASHDTATPPTGDGPTASGSVDLSGTGDDSGTAPPVTDTSAGVPNSPASDTAAASTTADVSTSSVGQTDSGSSPSSSLPLYQHVGSGPVDFTEWPLAASQDASGNPLYHYAGDTPGGAPTGASADWQVYTGPTQGQADASSASVPHTPIDTTNSGA